MDLNTIWTYNLVGHVGKAFVFTFELFDEDDTIVDLTGYTGSAKIVDADGTTIETITVQINESDGQFILNDSISSGTAPGKYEWRGMLIDASANEYPRFEGTVTLKTY